MRPRAIVEQICSGLLLRWRFTLRDEDDQVVHEGCERITKLEAMRDRDNMIRSAGNHRYDPDLPRELKVALWAVYDTRDRASAPGG